MSSRPRSGELRNLLWQTAIHAGLGVAPELRHKPTAVVHRLPAAGKSKLPKRALLLSGLRLRAPSYIGPDGGMADAEGLNPRS